MVTVSNLLANCPGLVPSNQSNKLPFQAPRCNRFKFNEHNAIPPVEMIPSRGIQSLVKPSGVKCVNSVGRDYNQLTFNDNVPEEPFWLSLIKEATSALKTLIVFLAEQPSQIKYIEWPGFQSTLKTATLTLVLVALLIVALSSVDSAFSFLLALLLRRTP